MAATDTDICALRILVMEGGSSFPADGNPWPEMEALVAKGLATRSDLVRPVYTISGAGRLVLGLRTAVADPSNREAD